MDGDFDSDSEDDSASDLDADVDSIADALFSGLLGGGGSGGGDANAGDDSDEDDDAEKSAFSDEVLTSIPGGRLPVVYLGSVAAKDTSIQSKWEAQLQAAMLKMSSSSKQREIMLGISKTSITFIDVATGAANVEHSTSDALACSASAAQPGVFGYLATSNASSKGFCHIFATSPDKVEGYAAALNRAVALGTMSSSNPFL